MNRLQGALFSETRSRKANQNTVFCFRLESDRSQRIPALINLIEADSVSMTGAQERNAGKSDGNAMQIKSKVGQTFLKKKHLNLENLNLSLNLKKKKKKMTTTAGTTAGTTKSINEAERMK